MTALKSTAQIPTRDAETEVRPEPIDQIRSLDRLIREHGSVAAAREQELIAMLGDSDVEAIIAKRPELLSEKGEDILRIQSMMRLSQSALRGAQKRLLDLAPKVIENLVPFARRIRDLHAANMERVREHTAAKLRAIGIPDDTLLVVLQRAKPVADEFEFQQAHPAEPVSFTWVRGEAGVDVILNPSAGAVISAFDQTMRNLRETEAHTKDLCQLFR